MAGTVDFDGGWVKLKVAPASARGRSAWMRLSNGLEALMAAWPDGAGDTLPKKGARI